LVGSNIIRHVKVISGYQRVILPLIDVGWQDAPLLMNGLRKCDTYIQWNSIQPQRRMKFRCLQVNGWNWRILSPVKLAWFIRPKAVCFLSYVDIRSRANTTRGLDCDHMIK
jgi:hypothetical protein